MINRLHFIRGILTEISCEFVSPRIVKSTQPIIRVKKESSYLSRLDFEFSYGHGQQLQEKENSYWRPGSLLESAPSFRSATYVCAQAVCVTRFDQSECVICGVILAHGKSQAVCALRSLSIMGGIQNLIICVKMARSEHLDRGVNIR